MRVERTTSDAADQHWRGLAPVEQRKSVGDYFDAIAWDAREPDASEMSAEDFLAAF